MKHGLVQFARVSGLFALLMLLVTASCGDDDGGSGASGAGNAGTTTSDGGAGGSGGTTTTGTGGMGLDCVDDGKCKSSEPCACGDCWLEQACNSDPNCIDDGTCGGQEGCFCADCVDEPVCADYCIDCHRYLTYYTDPEAICAAGGSKQLYDALESCACNTVCVTECASSFCAGQSPTQTCTDCLAQSCDTEWAACDADIKPFVKCNPVTAEPCNLTADQEHCDRIYVGDEVGGFRCFLRTHDAQLCDACNYNFGSTSYCAAGHTCGDGLGGLVDTGTCGRYCCDDGDCGTGTCLKGAFDTVDPDLGVCDTTIGGAGCDAPAEAASAGSCIDLAP